MLGVENVDKNVLAIVSPSKRDGRTYLAANLAVAFAQLGKRTLLLDCHLQKSRQDEIFRIQGAPGISTMLSGRSDVSAGPAPIEKVPYLFVYPAGPCPTNPDELIASDRFGNFLSEARRKFDTVLVDTPPGDSSTGDRLDRGPLPQCADRLPARQNQPREGTGFRGSHARAGIGCRYCAEPILGPMSSNLANPGPARPDRQFWLPDAPPRVQFVGIGAQKCASTWLHDVLAQHPEVCLPAHRRSRTTFRIISTSATNGTNGISPVPARPESRAKFRRRICTVRASRNAWPGTIRTCVSS